MRLVGVCCRSQGQPCSERKRSTSATSWRKDVPSCVRCPGTGRWPEEGCEGSGPNVGMVYLNIYYNRHGSYTSTVLQGDATLLLYMTQVYRDYEGSLCICKTLI